MAIELKTLNLAFRPLSDEDVEAGAEDTEDDDGSPKEVEGENEEEAGLE